ncbi:MAG: hypothetical protein QF789_03780 [Gammaproteobacteria bacterium]|nr:hypothetical protein [Gammaproteobacteria bacterium]MDP7296730.1 hypothetical protein [Gammaproteobacteria bacterium]MDP7660328.1 hypothetical protein [Gammaproteobacteria bacterium]
MRPNHSDMRMYADLMDLNRGFLGLLTAPRSQQAVPNFGLDAAIIDQLSRLSLAELEFIAATPGLLACFSQWPTVSMHWVAEVGTTRTSNQAAWRETARLYVTGLLTYLWQMEKRDWPCCALCAGSAELNSGSMEKFDFTRIHVSADIAVDQLQARFNNYPSFWTDLICSARSGNEDFRALSQLTIIPLALAEECSAE